MRPARDRELPELRARQLAALGVFRIAATNAQSARFDEMSLDPAFAPGTGTPEPGGLQTTDLLRIVRQLALEHDGGRGEQEGQDEAQPEARRARHRE